MKKTILLITLLRQSNNRLTPAENVVLTFQDSDLSAGWQLSLARVVSA